MKRLILYLLTALIAGAMLFGWGYQRGASSVEVRTSFRIDTVFYEKPQPYRMSEASASVNIPRVLFAPRDTVYKTVAVSNDADSIEIPVTIEHKEYGDSTYRAQVSGPRVGPLGPALDWIETYNRTTIRQQTDTERNRFAVTAGVGVGYTPHGLQPMVGVQVGVVLWSW